VTIDGQEAGPGTRQRGRPRLLDPVTERKLILDATITVLGRTSFDRATLDEILAEAGVGTRAFYRNFASKSEVLDALRDEEERRLAARLGDIAAAAGSPRAALEACVNDLLAIAYDPRRAARATMLGNQGMVDVAVSRTARRARLRTLTPPLARVLAAGQASGDFPVTDPERDARIIWILVFSVIEDARCGEEMPPLEEVRGHVLRFALGGLGAGSAHPLCMRARSGYLHDGVGAVRGLAQRDDALRPLLDP
jgi:AcrR family transcriptional regulator